MSSQSSESSITVGSRLQLPNGTELPSRILKSAMSEALGTRDHAPKPELFELYRRWGEQGGALLMTGNIMIDRRHLGEPGNVVVEDDRDLDLLKEWSRQAKQGGSHLWAQINHPGKQTPAFLCKEPLSASAVSLGLPGFNPPRAMTEAEILDAIERFGQTAAVLKRAGFDGVQIHGAHGYLVAQFLSPRHNQRTDQWGGDIDGRSRFVIEVYKAIRSQVGPDFPIGIKLNSSDFQRGGFSEEDSIVVMKKLQDLGIDLIEISGGTYEAPSMMGGKGPDTSKLSDEEKSRRSKNQAYFIEFATKAKQAIEVPIAVTGGHRHLDQMNQALADGQTDMVGLARPFVLFPDLAREAISGSRQDFVTPFRLSTGIKALDKALMIGLTWYTQQIHVLGAGKTPKADLHPMRAAIKLMLGTGWQNFRRTRA